VGHTIASMERQTVPPAAWFIRGRYGSTDGTPGSWPRPGEDLLIHVIPGGGRRHRNPAEAVTEGFNQILPGPSRWSRMEVF